MLTTRVNTQVVLVCTSASELKGHPTGLWIEELAAPYYAFKEAGYEIIIASPAGGPIPLDQNSFGEGSFTDHAKKFMVRMSFNDELRYYSTFENSFSVEF